MECVTLPVQVLDSVEFLSLKIEQKMLLIDLYVLFGDCVSFTIDMERPTDYRQKKCDDITMYRRVSALIEAGLIIVTLRPAQRRGPSQRIYSFKYSTIEA